MDSLFYVPQPKFNQHGIAMKRACDGKLLQHQCQALEALMKWFKEGNSEIALVSMPTGSGKTGVICCLPYFLGSIGLEGSRDPSRPSGTPIHEFNGPILVLAPTLDLANQLEGRILVADNNNENFFVRRKIIQGEKVLKAVLPHGRKIEGTQELTRPDPLKHEDVIISNVQKFLSKKQLPEDAQWWVEELPSDLFKLVIVDEAHHFPASTWKRIIDQFKGHALVVFFTATPYRSVKPGQTVPVVNPPFAYHLPLSDARERGIIRTTNAVYVDSSSETREAIFLAVLGKVKELQERKNREQPFPDGVPHMAIAITKTTDDADVAAQLWNSHVDKYETAIAYHSKLGKNQPQLPELMKQIKNNDGVKLVVVVAKLQEGFDHPHISIAAILTNIKSPRKFVQFVGRAQRIVRFQEHQESTDIKADIVMHSYDNQQGNYESLEREDFVKTM